MACCPPGSWGELKADADYKNKGAVEKLDGLEVYVTGNTESARQVQAAHVHDTHYDFRFKIYAVKPRGLPVGSKSEAGSRNGPH